MMCFWRGFSIVAAATHGEELMLLGKCDGVMKCCEENYERERKIFEMK